MTIRAADVVAPMFTTSKIVAFFLAGVAGKAGLGYFFRRLVFE
jgi:hypothetical protein